MFTETIQKCMSQVNGFSNNNKANKNKTYKTRLIVKLSKIQTDSYILINMIDVNFQLYIWGLNDSLN